MDCPHDCPFTAAASLQTSIRLRAGQARDLPSALAPGSGLTAGTLQMWCALPMFMTGVEPPHLPVSAASHRLTLAPSLLLLLPVHLLI